MDSWVKTASTEVAFFVNGVKARACFPCLYFLVPFIPFTLSVHPSLSPAKGGREESSTRNDLPVLLEEPPYPPLSCRSDTGKPVVKSNRTIYTFHSSLTVVG
jgi:hypothetical protein